MCVRLKKMGLSVVLASLLVTHVLPVYAQTKWYDDSDIVRADLSYEDMEYVGYDPSYAFTLIEEMRAMSQESGHEEQINANYDLIGRELDKMYTQQALNQIRYYRDVNNQEYADIDTQLQQTYRDVVDKFLQAVRDTLNTDYRESLGAHINDEEVVEEYLEYEDLTEELQTLLDEENALEQQYDQASMAEYTVTVKGKKWTEESYNEAAEDLTWREMLAISSALDKAKNEAICPIFLELVRNRNARARINDYDNYAQYAYTDLYNRDYSIEDITGVYAAVKEYIVPVLAEVEQYVYAGQLNDLLYMDYLTEDYVIDVVGRHMGDIDPALAEVYQYMVEHHLYDIDYDPNKMNVGYTTTLYEYQEPFIFNTPDYSYYDLETMIHEFGHYNEAFHAGTTLITDVTNMDVAEIHSQGLELLYLDYADDVYGEGLGDTARQMVLYQILYSVVDGCLYDEFQNAVFSADHDMTVQEVNQLFRRLSEEYGYVYYDDGDEAYDWVDVPHTFSSPMYYISYGTSALAALEIWTIAQEDRQAGIDKYMELTTYGLTTTYCELMEECGLKSIFEEGTIREIAQTVSRYTSALASGDDTADDSFGGYDEDEDFDLDSFLSENGWSDPSTNDYSKVTSLMSEIESLLQTHMYIMYGAQILTAITILIIIAVLSVKEKKR
ncbi:MAG: hypothetical protein NC543_11495 [bacterium]|nr:hypothetical protein [bacterium]MCM1375890.1 hypothetical protein [Muribaculum sp.]